MSVPAYPRPMARLLASTRYLVMIPVVGIVIMALATFGWAVAMTLDFVRDLVTDSTWQEQNTVVDLLQVLDLYLIGTVLIITAIGLYELFIGHVDVPGWLVITSLSDLKAKIVDVLVLVIGIKFLEKAVRSGEAIDVLWYGLGSAVVMAVLVGWNAVKGRSS
jgi:uncharacterized membrane protein YqhA